MAEFNKVTDLGDLSNLDENEILSGYQSGFRGDPAPGSDRSRSGMDGAMAGLMVAGPSRTPVRTIWQENTCSA